jgi:hypothetical protein
LVTVPPHPTSPAEPSAYRIAGPEPHLRRESAPEVRLFVDRRLAVLESELASYPDQVLFLDGVFTGPPFVDNRRRHYSLDHHQGCVRPFTLATCEQAAVMVANGLPLGEGQWHIYFGEPDLDALLAGWVLLNHRRLAVDDGAALWSVMPLLRTEGVIDAHGLNKGAVSGLSRQEYGRHKGHLEQLRVRELALKAADEWQDDRMLSYVKEQYDHLDQLLPLPEGAPEAPPSDAQLVDVRMPKRVALVRSRVGIYEVEADLRRRYGTSVGIIVLDAGGGTMTLLQVDPFLPTSLDQLYPVLNQRDPKADADSGNLWGGSSGIGGSPRVTGTGLSGSEVLRIVSGLYGSDRDAG